MGPPFHTHSDFFLSPCKTCSGEGLCSCLREHVSGRGEQVLAHQRGSRKANAGEGVYRGRVIGDDLFEEKAEGRLGPL